MSLIGLVAAAYAVSAVLRLRSEETAGRAEPVLAAPLSRAGWGGQPPAARRGRDGRRARRGRSGLGSATACASRGRGRQLPRLLGAALAQLPAALVIAAVAVALFGLLPRWRWPAAGRRWPSRS